MPALSFTLNQLAAALLGAGAYIYHANQRGGWNACAIVCGTRIERSSPDPYAALGAVAQVLIDYEAQQAALDAYDTPAARAAYRQAWAASEGQPVPARFAAAEAAAAATESAGWPSTIRTEQDNTRTMQRLRSITGRPSATPAATSDEQPAPDDDSCSNCGGTGSSWGHEGDCPQCFGTGYY
jgi:DnaJ-class molecular chaperone